MAARQRLAAVLRHGSVSAAALIAGVPLAASAQSLEDALTSAYANNPTLQAERALLRSTDEDVPQALSNWRPTVSLSASQGYTHDGFSGNLGAEGLPGVTAPIGSPNGSVTEALHPYSYGVTITQPVYRGGRTAAQTEQALDLVRAERANLVNVEQTIFITVVTDYMNVVEQQATVDLNINNEQVLRKQLEATQDQFRVGEKTRTDVAEAEAAFAQAVSQRLAAEGQLQVFRVTYQHDVGDLPGKLTAPSAIPELPTGRDEAVGLAAQAAPAVIQAQYTQAAAEANVNLVKGALLPTLSVQGTAQRATDQQEAGTRIDEYAVTAQLSMPLYEGGATYSQARAAAQVVAQRKSQLDDARRVAVENAAQAWEQLQSTRATIKSEREQIRANEIALEGVQQEASVGSRTILDILNQEQTLFQSRVSLVTSQRDEVVFEFTLAQSIGRLNAKSPRPAGGILRSRQAFRSGPRQMVRLRQWGLAPHSRLHRRQFEV